jgi:hypothetical protein
MDGLLSIKNKNYGLSLGLIDNCWMYCFASDINNVLLSENSNLLVWGEDSFMA